MALDHCNFLIFSLIAAIIHPLHSILTLVSRANFLSICLPLYFYDCVLGEISSSNKVIINYLVPRKHSNKTDLHAKRDLAYLVLGV